MKEGVSKNRVRFEGPDPGIDRGLFSFILGPKGDQAGEV